MLYSLLNNVTISLHEEHMPVAMDAFLAELKVRHLAAASLPQEVDRAVVV